MGWTTLGRELSVGAVFGLLWCSCIALFIGVMLNAHFDAKNTEVTLEGQIEGAYSSKETYFFVVSGDKFRVSEEMYNEFGVGDSVVVIKDGLSNDRDTAHSIRYLEVVSE